MNNFKYINNMNIDELATWLDEKFSGFYDSPWEKWWNKNYCDKCEPEIGRFKGEDRDAQFCWCELHGKCKYFQELVDTPDGKKICKMWLENEKNE